MRKILSIATLGVAVLTMGAAPIAAQPVTPPGQTNQGAAQANFGNLISALNNINAQIDQINALNNIDISRVHIVDVDDVANGNNVQALNNALNGVDLTVLQNFLNGNTVLNNVLNNANVLVTDVVAVNVLNGGDIIIFKR